MIEVTDTFDYNKSYYTIQNAKDINDKKNGSCNGYNVNTTFSSTTPSFEKKNMNFRFVKDKNLALFTKYYGEYICVVTIPKENVTIFYNKEEKYYYTSGYILHANIGEYTCFHSQYWNWNINDYIVNPSLLCYLTKVQLEHGKKEAICLELIEKQSITYYENLETNYFQYIKEPTYNICIAAIMKYPKNILYISNPSEEYKILALQQDGLLLPYFFKEKEEPSFLLYFHAVTQNPKAIDYITNPSEELCWIAIKQDPHMIKYIKSPTDAMWIYVLRLIPSLLQYLKKHQYHLYYFAITLDGNNIVYIHPKYLTDELCFKAVEQNGFALKHIPSSKYTSQLIEKAVQQNGLALKWVTKEYQTETVCQFAKNQNPLASQFEIKQKQNQENEQKEKEKEKEKE